MASSSGLKIRRGGAAAAFASEVLGRAAIHTIGSGAVPRLEQNARRRARERRAASPRAKGEHSLARPDHWQRRCAHVHLGSEAIDLRVWGAVPLVRGALPIATRVTAIARRGTAQRWKVTAHPQTGHCPSKKGHCPPEKWALPQKRGALTPGKGAVPIFRGAMPPVRGALRP